MEIEKKTIIGAKDGKITANFDAALDSNKDGRHSVEAGMYVKIDPAELVREVAKDKATFLALAAAMDQYKHLIPEIQKEV